MMTLTKKIFFLFVFLTSSLAHGALRHAIRNAMRVGGPLAASYFFSKSPQLVFCQENGEEEDFKPVYPWNRFDFMKPQKSYIPDLIEKQGYWAGSFPDNDLEGFNKILDRAFTGRAITRNVAPQTIQFGGKALSFILTSKGKLSSKNKSDFPLIEELCEHVFFISIRDHLEVVMRRLHPGKNYNIKFEFREKKSPLPIEIYDDQCLPYHQDTCRSKTITLLAFLCLKREGNNTHWQRIGRSLRERRVPDWDISFAPEWNDRDVILLCESLEVPLQGYVIDQLWGGKECLLHGNRSNFFSHAFKRDLKNPRRVLVVQVLVDEDSSDAGGDDSFSSIWDYMERYFLGGFSSEGPFLNF